MPFAAFPFDLTLSFHVHLTMLFLPLSHITSFCYSFIVHFFQMQNHLNMLGSKQPIGLTLTPHLFIHFLFDLVLFLTTNAFDLLLCLFQRIKTDSFFIFFKHSFKVLTLILLIYRLFVQIQITIAISLSKTTFVLST